MTYFVSAIEHLNAHSGGSYDLPPGTIEDDFILGFYARRFGGAPTASGTNITWNNGNSVGNVEYFHGFQGATLDSTVSVAASSASTILILAAFRGIDTTTPIDSANATGSASSNTYNSPGSVSPTNDKSMLVHLIADKSGLTGFPIVTPGLQYVGSHTNGSNCAMAVFCQVFRGTGTIDQKTWTSGVYANNSRNPLMLVLNDSGEGKEKGNVSYVNAPARYLHVMGYNGESGNLSASTTQDDVTGYTNAVSTYEGSTITNSSFTRESGMFFPNMNTGSLEPGSSAPVTLARGAVLASAQDLTGEIIALSPKTNSDVGSVSNSAGVFFGLSNGNYSRLWQLSGDDVVPSIESGVFPCVIQPDDTNFDHTDYGTFDVTSLDRVILGCDFETDFTQFGTTPIKLLDPIEIVNGTSDADGFPANFGDAERDLRGLDYLTVQAQSQQSQNQFLCVQKVRVGNGGTEGVHWDARGQSSAWPDAYDFAARRIQFKLGAAAVGFELYLGSGDTAHLGDHLYYMGNSHYWGPHDSTATSGVTVTTSGAVVINATLGNDASPNELLPLGADYEGMLFSNCKGATDVGTSVVFDGTTFDGCQDTRMITVDSQAKLTALAGLTFKNQSVCIFISGNHSALTFPGNVTFDGSNTNTVEYDSNTTDLTLTVPATTTGLTQGSTLQSGTSTITVENSATVTIQNVQSGDVYRVYNDTDSALVEEGTASGTTVTINAVIPDGKSLSCVVARGGANTLARFEGIATTASGAASFTANLTSDSARVANDTTALAYSGISISSGVVTVSGTRTIQELYDYTRAWSNQLANLDEDVPLTTADGLAHNQGSGYSITVTGSLSSVTETIDGTITVSSGGFYEGSDGAKWENGGSIYYAKHVYRNVKDVDTNSNQQHAVVACWDTDNDIDVTYNTSLTNGGLTTDASGNIEGYYVYQVDATTYTLSEYIGLYGFSWSTIPVASNGTPIGASGGYEVVRMVTDANVTLTRVNALAVSGITVTHGADEIDFNSDSHSDVQDNLKARQARTADIETGKAGYVSYYEEGHLLSFDGSVYNLNSDWTAQNIADTSATLKGGTVELGTAGDIDFNFDSLTIDYTAASGTFDHRNEVMNGTITFVNSGGGSLTVQIDPTVSYTNTGPNITIDASVAVTATINSVDSAGAAENFPTGTRLRVSVSSGENADAWAATTGKSVGDLVLRSTGAGTEDGAGGTASGLYYECTTAGTTGGSEPTFPTTTGATVTDGTVVWTCRVIEVYNAAPGAVSSVNINHTYLANNTFSWRCIAIDGTNAKTWATGTFTVGSSGGSASITSVTNEVYETNNIDGSTVTEFTIDAPNVEVDVTDGDNTTSLQRAFNWWNYYLSTESGIRTFTDLFVAIDENNYEFDGSLTVENKKTDALYITGGVLVRSDGNSWVNTSGGSIIVTPDRVYNITTSGVTAADVATEVWAKAVDGSVSAGQSMQIQNSAAAGKVNGAASTTVNVRDLADTKDRMSATVDANGNRTAVTVSYD